jgi:HNH endonuclease
MSRKVYLSSDISSDDRLIDVASENQLAALLWPWFLTALDDWGRCEASAKQLKARIFPMIESVTVADVETALTLFAANRLIELYEVSGIRFLACLFFLRDQKRYSVRPSRYPDPLPVGPRAQAIAEYLQDCHQWRVKPKSPWMRYRRYVFQRDGFVCVYCSSEDRTNLTVDHVLPRSRGGSDSPENLVTACWTCNRQKWARTPEEWRQ